MLDVCTRCGGTGKIFVDDLHERECICAHARALKQHLGKMIVEALNVESSELFVPGANGEPDVDRTSDNLVLRGNMGNLLSHVKYALVWKGRMYPFRMVGDEGLLTVWLGKESYSARSKNLRDDVETFNSLNDYIGGEYALVIIQLAVLSQRNVAMPGVLKEALMIRRLCGKATWILEDTDRPFGPGHLAYNSDVEKLIEEHFEVLDLTGPYTPSVPEEPLKAHVEDTGLDEPPPTTARYTKSVFDNFQSRRSSSSDISGDAALSSSKTKWGKKPSKGGGPI